MNLREPIAAPCRTDEVRVFGVEYTHIRFQNRDDLYLTKYGRPFLENLLPENWFSDRTWFSRNAVRLVGSSTLFRVRTKPVLNRQIDLVLKWNRMGQDIPGAMGLEELSDGRFNSPFEEFALLIEMRDTRLDPPSGLYTHKPLGIYVPGERKDLDRLGRREYRMLPLLELHREIELDMFRSYGVIYQWIKGIDAVDAVDRRLLSPQEVAELTLDAEKRMRQRGFFVRDRKPHHLIVRPSPKRRGGLAQDRNGQVLYALVDFELLQRTQDRQERARREKQEHFLRMERERFSKPVQACPRHATLVNILGVDYVHGYVASTNGKLWVVGGDTGLFDYFLPERWEVTPRMKVSAAQGGGRRGPHAEGEPHPGVVEQPGHADQGQPRGAQGEALQFRTPQEARAEGSRRAS